MKQGYFLVCAGVGKYKTLAMTSMVRERIDA
jgi:hypothetical protein